MNNVKQWNDSKSLKYKSNTCTRFQTLCCPNLVAIRWTPSELLSFLLPHRLFRQSWTKVLGTAWKYDTCSLIALFSTLWRVAFAQSDVPPPPGQCCSEKVHYQPTDTTLRGGGGTGKSKRGDFQRKSAGVPTLLSRIVGWWESVQFKFRICQNVQNKQLFRKLWKYCKSDIHSLRNVGNDELNNVCHSYHVARHRRRNFVKGKMCKKNCNLDIFENTVSLIYTLWAMLEMMI